MSQLGAGQSILPEPAQFPQPEASGGLEDCEKISTGNESQEQLGPFGRQGPAALSPRRLRGLGPHRPLPQWVITTRCPAADVTPQGREGRGTLGSSGNSWTRINIPGGKGGAGLFSVPGIGAGVQATQGARLPYGVPPSPSLRFLLNSPRNRGGGVGSLGQRKGHLGGTFTMSRSAFRSP